MIRSIKSKGTEKIFNRITSRKLPIEIQQRAMRKLWMLDAAQNLLDLKVPSSNNLEKLKGSKEGIYSIRINSQWRICFQWLQNNAYGVEIIDYH